MGIKNLDMDIGLWTMPEDAKELEDNHVLIRVSMLLGRGRVGDIIRGDRLPRNTEWKFKVQTPNQYWARGHRACEDKLQRDKSTED